MANCQIAGFCGPAIILQSVDRGLEELFKVYPGKTSVLRHIGSFVTLSNYRRHWTDGQYIESLSSLHSTRECAMA